MKTDVLSSILDGQKGVRRDGASYVFDDRTSATVFAGTAGELITVPRVVRIDLAKEMVTLLTSKSERFFFPYEVVIGLKLEESEERARSGGGAGFR